jgi:hypothetical protein
MKIITNALGARRDWKRKRAVKVVPPRKPSTIHGLIEAWVIRSAETPLGHRLTRAEIERLVGGPLDDEQLGSLLQQILA